MKVLLRVLAFLCRVCPFCIVARRMPESRFALTMKKLERFCPCCRAYTEIVSKKSQHG